MGFKEDESFLRFISMGAEAARDIARRLSDHHGHRLIELERYAMSNKIWAEKVKRLRLPDLLCIRCGVRIEVRAKSDLAVRMSHSAQEGRGWDYSLRDEDIIAFAQYNADDDPPVGDAIYFTTGSLREVEDQARGGAVKSAAQGSEADLTWDVAVAGRAGVVEELSGGRPKVKYDKTASKSAWTGWIGSKRLEDGGVAAFDVGDRFDAGEVIAGVALPRTGGHLDCAGDVWDIAAALHSGDPHEQFAAVRACSARMPPELIDDVRGLASGQDVDPRLKLEAMGALARHGHGYADDLRDVALRTEGPTSELAMALEAVLILEEIATTAALDAIAEVADATAGITEAGTAAVWALGRNAHPSVADYVGHPDESLAMHAIASVHELTPPLKQQLVAKLESGDHRSASGALAALERNEAVETLVQVANRGGAGAGRALVSLRRLGRELVDEADAELDAQLRAALEPFWEAESQDWAARGETPFDIDFLERQRFREDPYLDAR